MINIVLADDHKVVRKEIKALLSTEPDFNVIGEVGNGLDTVSLVERIKPDILVLDMMMPGMNGLEVTRTLTSRGSRTGIVILSMQNVDAYICQVLRFGAKAYVLKEAPTEELVKAIREVMAGRWYLCSALSENILIQYQSQKKENRDDSDLKMTACGKEMTILAVNGIPNKEIAS